jgi:hypothetical protein
MDSRYENDDSFLKTGPVRWINVDSLFKPAVWTDLTAVLEAAGEIDSRLSRIKMQTARVEDLSIGGKHLLLFICDLIAVFGPCPEDHVAFYLAGLGVKSVDLSLNLTLGCATGLLRDFNISSGHTLYFRPLEDGDLPSFHYTKEKLGIPFLRANVLSKMQQIDSAREALLEMGKFNVRK